MSRCSEGVSRALFLNKNGLGPLVPSHLAKSDCHGHPTDPTYEEIDSDEKSYRPKPGERPLRQQQPTQEHRNQSNENVPTPTLEMGPKRSRYLIQPAGQKKQ